MTRNGVVAAVVAVAALAGSATAFAQDDVLQRLKDREAIELLMWRYVRALDTNDAAAYAAVYTPDGQFKAGATATSGRDALTKMVADLKSRNAEAAAKGETRPPLFHMTANQRLEFVDKTNARLYTYWMTVAGAAGQQNPPRVLAAGHGVDHLVKVNGQWLIKLRDVAPDTPLQARPAASSAAR